LETFEIQGERQTAYCVVQSESIPVGELHDLERLCRLHGGMIEALNKKNYVMVEECISHLLGKFGGELDSFYNVLQERIARENSIV
jgi:hypothetical protein